ncbi:MAG: 4Fe-4S cluster-binding domain-containing protein [Gammaproteobacteria bacterium]|nr:4Fe-4S cluster-binding domain-containing protein [Gammaproteobacteria bacterium]MBT7370582.1 4Fe-4S cluster-binding domain-containing protein [Gammaproteobacteria bacterium]
MTDRFSKDSILADLKATPLPVVIFGASPVGHAVQELCERESIAIAAYCDNKNYKMDGTYNGHPVLNPQTLPATFPDGAQFIIVAADINDVVVQLAGMSFKNWFPGGLLLTDFDITASAIDETEAFANYVIGATINCHDAYVSEDRIFMRSVDLVLTERCSLKCQDCSNLMQYYERPVNYELDQMQQSLTNLLSLVDGIQEIRIIGGEPLVNKSFHLVVNRLITEPDVQQIVIYTNGTIAPPDEKLAMMQSDKVMVLITDYGELSRNKQELMDGLDRHNIAWHIDDAKGWTDCSSIGYHERSEQEKVEVFQECCAKGLITISNGSIYRCPFSANASQLNAVPHEPSDWVDLESIHLIDQAEARASIRSFLYDRKYLKVCDYCGGRPLYAPEITAGIQTRKPVGYEIFPQEEPQVVKII